MYDLFYATGCSNTYGTDMMDIDPLVLRPSVNSWPSVLQRIIHAKDFTNTAVPGSSNYAIMRKILVDLGDYRYRNPDAKILCGIMLSSFERIEIYYDKFYTVAPWTLDIDNLDKDFKHAVEKYFVQLQNDDYDQLKTFLDVLNIQNFCKMNKIDYFITFSWTSQFVRRIDSPIVGDNWDKIMKQIDFRKIYLSNGYYEWGILNKYEQGPTKHLTERCAKDFTHQLLYPWVRGIYDF